MDEYYSLRCSKYKLYFKVVLDFNLSKIFGCVVNNLPPCLVPVGPFPRFLAAASSIFVSAK